MRQEFMRITTGKYKGRIITMPKGIRPTQNKVRKALFDVLGDIGGLTFLELFAGSGAVGFEAVSRGVDEVVMIENDADCLKAIKVNIESLNLHTCHVYHMDVEKAVKMLHKQRRLFEIIFLDPPYYGGLFLRPSKKFNKRSSGLADASIKDSLAKKTLKILGAYDILAPNGLAVVQHFKKDILPEEIRNLTIVKQARYGDTVLSFYRKCAR